MDVLLGLAASLRRRSERFQAEAFRHFGLWLADAPIRPRKGLDPGRRTTWTSPGCMSGPPSFPGYRSSLTHRSRTSGMSLLDRAVPRLVLGRPFRPGEVLAVLPIHKPAEPPAPSSNETSPIDQPARWRRSRASSEGWRSSGGSRRFMGRW